LRRPRVATRRLRRQRDLLAAVPGKRNFRTAQAFSHHTTKFGEWTMDWNRVEGNWKQVKGQVKEKWGQLTDDDLDKIAGQRDQLEGKIQERYGIAKDQVKKDIDDWYGTQRWN
jgi:uncharacterized protein YjbJ (UPF0337 family)